MTDKEYLQQKRRVEKLAKYWVNRIGLGWWRIDFHYIRDGWEEPSTIEYFNTLMLTRSDWTYRLASIQINVVKLVDVGDELLEECFVHELCHILINAMSTPTKRNEEEFTATTVAKGFIGLKKSLVK